MNTMVALTELVSAFNTETQQYGVVPRALYLSPLAITLVRPTSGTEEGAAIVQSAGMKYSVKESVSSILGMIDRAIKFHNALPAGYPV